MAERRVAARLEAVVSNFINGFKDAKKSVDDLTQSTQNANKATQDNSRFSEEAAKKIKLVAEADQRAAKNAGLLYNANGQLVNSNGKIVSSSQAAAHGVDAFSDAVYLANVEAQEAAAATQAAVAKQAEAYQTLAPAVTVAGGAISLAFGKMLGTYANFDKSMSEVQAATHETAGNMDLLRDSAVEAGADTAFSASEAAGGIKELAKAGVDTQSIINGGLSGALSLAASDNIEVAKAAEIAASAMTQFKLSGEEVPHIADLLAAGAGKAQGGVEDLGEALNQSGLVANGVGLTIEETTGALTAFASAGLTGSDAGTSFKTMLQALTPNSKEAAKLMEDLGISAYDANGSFVGMSEYAGILQGALKGMTDEQRNATLETIFGSDAVRAANILYAEGADGIQQWEQAVNDAGYAAETAAAMQDNLSGDLEKLGGAFDTVFLKSGSGANDVLRTFVQTTEDFVDFVGTIPEPILSIAGILTGIVGGTALAGGALLTAIPKIKDGVEAFKDLNSSTSKTPGVLGKVAKAAGLAATAVAAIQVAGEFTSEKQITSASEFASAINDVANAGESAQASDLDGVFKKWDLTKGAENDAEAVNSLSKAIGTLADPSAGQKVKNFFNPLTSFLGSTPDEITQVEGKLYDLGDALGEAVKAGNGQGAADTFSLVVEQFKATGKSAYDAADSMPGYIDSLRDVATAAGVTVSEQELVNWAISGIKPASIDAVDGAGSTVEALDEVGVSAEGVVEDMQEFLDILFEAGVITRDERAALRDYKASIDEISASIEENGTTLDINTEKGRANQEAYDGLAASGQAYVEALAAGGASEADLQAAMSSTYDSLIVAAEQFGITGGKADQMARDVMGIPDDVKVDSWMSEAAKKTAEDTKKSIESIPERHDVKIVQTFETHGTPYRAQNPLQKQLQSSLPSSVFGKRASGGSIFGPGSGTSDSIPIMASNGEHMLTANEVELMGGHDAVYQFRSALRAGGIRGHATGGEIGGAPAGVSTASVMQSSVITVPSGGGSDLPPISIEIHGATDERRVARAVTEQLSAKLAAGGMRIGR